MNLFGFAGGDPLNNGDSFGLECRRTGTATLYCDNFGSGDAETIRDFLGGSVGGEVYDWLRQDIRFQSENCQGGFSGGPNGQCMRIANATSSMINHWNRRCWRRGSRAARRWQAGRLISAPGVVEGDFGWALIKWPRSQSIVGLADDAFEEGELARTIGEEEGHIELGRRGRLEQYHYLADRAGRECQNDIY